MIRVLLVLLCLHITCHSGAHDSGAHESGTPKSGAPDSGAPDSGAPGTWNDSRLNLSNVPNALQLHANVISGGVPAGSDGFTELSRLGVKTIISVDGAEPDVATAQKLGLRYVHLPHGYDGISSSQAQGLAKAVSELPGPIYIHCHHGKHRSPAAAMVACIGAGLTPNRQGVDFLKTAGTSPKYVGLYAAVKDARRFQQTELSQLDIAFPEIAEVPPLAKVMVNIQKRFDNLVAAEQSSWSVTTLGSELDPSHDALMLREHLSETSRTHPSNEQPEEFRQMLQSSRAAALRMESLLGQQPRSSETRSGLSKQLSVIRTDCQRCHAKYRDRSSQ